MCIRDSIKIIPAPLGFPAESFPSTANCLPRSFGKNLFNFAIAIHVLSLIHICVLTKKCGKIHGTALTIAVLGDSSVYSPVLVLIHSNRCGSCLLYTSRCV